MGIGWSMHRNDGWRGQLDRAARWHKRVVSAANTAAPDLEDFTYTFFQNCYHLREWMLQTGGASQLELDEFFARNIELQVCRDVCNGTKHLNLSHASVDRSFSIGREYTPGEPLGFRMFIVANDQHYDLIHLADRCLMLWQKFTERVRN